MRGETLPPKLDLASIIDPSPFKAWDLYRFWIPLQEFWIVLRGLPGVKSVLPGFGDPPRWKSYHFSTKKGPGGRHALLESWADFLSLPKEMIQSIKTVGGWQLEKRMDFLSEHRDLLMRILGTREKVSLRKITGIQDREGKTRVIAILDYWSQTALKPLHDLIFGILKCIPQDMTFSQGEFLEKVQN